MNTKKKETKASQKEKYPGHWTHIIDQLELNNESGSPTKASGVTLTIKTKVTYKDPNSKYL